MFATSSQPSIVSLFSSTGSEPLQLFSRHTDPALPADSIIHLLHDASSQPPPLPPATVIYPPLLNPDTTTDVDAHPDEGGPGGSGYALDHTVVHIQSPTLRTTYIRCPPRTGTEVGLDLGMTHPWVHVQVRNMGREWAFEVGVVDRRGRRGIVRCSTFQKRPRLKFPSGPRSVPLLHLPLSFPTASSRPLTAWATVTLNLPPLLAQFSSPALAIPESDDDDDDTEMVGESWTRSPTTASVSSAQLPGGMYSHASYVKVYATCRLRRIWFSETLSDQRMPWEFQLCAAE